MSVAAAQFNHLTYWTLGRKPQVGHVNMHVRCAPYTLRNYLAKYDPEKTFYFGRAGGVCVKYADVLQGASGRSTGTRPIRSTTTAAGLGMYSAGPRCEPLYAS